MNKFIYISVACILSIMLFACDEKKMETPDSGSGDINRSISDTNNKGQHVSENNSLQQSQQPQQSKVISDSINNSVPEINNIPDSAHVKGYVEPDSDENKIIFSE